MFVVVAWSAALVFAAMLGAPLTGHAEEQPRPAPSFACGEATQWVEKTICSAPDLTALDRRLSLLFAEAKRELAPHAGELLATQRAWLREREDCRTEEEKPANQVQCLSGRYAARIHDLEPELPVLARLRQPVSAARANEVMALFHWMTPDDLIEVTTHANSDALAEVSCRFFELYPKEAAELFKAIDYSNRDTMRPLCSTIDVVTQVPATSRLLIALWTISGDSKKCHGTYLHGVIRTQLVARIMAVVDGAPDIDARGRTDADADAALKRHPDLALWGMQGLWEKRRYAELRDGVARARPALAADYARRFHLDAVRADRLAAYHIQRLIEVYVGRGSSAGSGSYSLCLTTADLDGYLATGKVPDKKCPRTEFADPAPQATLRRLLGLAIVNDYPTRVVKRLIAAGARVDPPDLGAQVEESRESLLMLAAASADVIDALLAAGADPKRGNAFGKTALMYAVQELDLEGVRRLIQAGADVDAATKVGDVCEVFVQPGGRTALMYAAWQATPEIVRALLDAHADPGRADSEGKTAADYVDANANLSREERLATKALLRQ
ncbi:MAG TPA: ankyrin repeat domain-containing protein [Thermoanaerobaculia bacterium]|jgi:uncharacterized protein|nr:ankyrin repeat domain-containing protein [Thermoanaerobaculia bacterium]